MAFIEIIFEIITVRMYMTYVCGIPSHSMCVEVTGQLHEIGPFHLF